MEFLFRNRGEGKRQVKPSQDIALLEDQIAAESSDDSDYVIDSKNRGEESGDDASGSSSDSDSGSSSSSGSGGGEGDGEDSESEDLTSEINNLNRPQRLSTGDLLELSKKQIETSKLLKLDVKVCGCCLGSSSSDANEIVDCDGCGISVHEGCYGITESGSIASTVSSASTEPWFCEPCRAGCTKSPDCELCPVVGGVYKETDVGRWVHLVCALYVPGVAFGDTDKMCHVTIFEMNYSMWGRKVCSICSSPDQSSTLPGAGVRFSRTGVCIQCDAGLCKSFFHASCAHAAGLLSEPTYEHHGGYVDDAYLAHCKIHSDRETVRKRRKSFMIHHLQSKKKGEEIKNRMGSTAPLSPARRLSSRSIPGETPDERILRKLYRKQHSFRNEKLKSPGSWLPTQKIPRMLATSASAIRKIQRFNEVQGLDLERQSRQEIQIQAVTEAKKKWHVPPAFSLEFVAYYEDRARRIADLKAQVADDLHANEALAKEDAKVREKFQSVSKGHEESLKLNNSLRNTIDSYRSLLTTLGSRQLPDKSAIPALKPLVRQIEIVTPNVKARATVYSQNPSQKPKSQFSGEYKTNACGICKKTHNQHLLAHCDTCKLHYHLSCLSPPLSRMPKKSKLYGWSCSECYPDSSSADEAVAEEDEDTSDATRMRNRKRRLAASRALVANSRNSSDFETEWPVYSSAPKIPPKIKKGTKRGRPRKNPVLDRVRGIHGPSNGASSSDQDAASESIQPMPPNGSPKDEVYSNNSNSNEDIRQSLIDKAQAKAEKKEQKKAEKERRKLEKKKRKKLLKEAKKKEAKPLDSDVEIIEEDGQCTVGIKPKPIKLGVDLGSNAHVLTATPQTSNGHVSSADDTPISTPVSTPTEPPAKKRRTSSTGLGKVKDLRTNCDKCSQEGNNSNLVRCDECKRCFHFECLIPPLKKSPKVAGYGWHCSECDPSDVDSDWHLD